MIRDKLVLGENCVFDSDPAVTGINGNVLVEGCTGSGKTWSVIFPRLLYLEDSNLILSDPKRELIEFWAPTLRKKGYRVLEINLKDPAKSSICFNHFCYLQTDLDVSTLAEGIHNLIPQNKNTTADVFWKKNFLACAKFAIYYCMETKDDPSLADVFDLLNRIRVDDSGTLLKINISGEIESVIRSSGNKELESAYRAFSENPIRTGSNILSDFRSTLSGVLNQELLSMLRCKPSFSLDDFVQDKTVLFISCDGMNEAMNAYVNMIFDTLMPLLMRTADRFPNGRLPIPVHMIVDDFACGTPIRSFPSLIAKFRSKGISSTIVLQDQEQLKSLYGENSAATVMNNCDTMVYLGGNSLTSARNWSVRLNVPIDEVLYMPLAHVAVYRRGSRPVLTRRYAITRDPNFIKAGREAEKAKDPRKTEDNEARKSA